MHGLGTGSVPRNGIYSLVPRPLFSFLFGDGEKSRETKLKRKIAVTKWHAHVL